MCLQASKPCVLLRPKPYYALLSTSLAIARTKQCLLLRARGEHTTQYIVLLDCVELTPEEVSTDDSAVSFIWIRSSFLFFISVTNLRPCATFPGWCLRDESLCTLAAKPLLTPDACRQTLP